MSGVRVCSSFSSSCTELGIVPWNIRISHRHVPVQSFWQPQGTPASQLRASKPSIDVPCPVTGKKLRLKDLTPVNFTPASDDTDNSYMDPVSKDLLSNSSRLVVIKPSGDVLLEKTYRACIKPDGIYKGGDLSPKPASDLCCCGCSENGPEGSPALVHSAIRAASCTSLQVTILKTRMS